VTPSVTVFDNFCPVVLKNKTLWYEWNAKHRMQYYAKKRKTTILLLLQLYIVIDCSCKTRADDYSEAALTVRQPVLRTAASGWFFQWVFPLYFALHRSPDDVIMQIIHEVQWRKWAEPRVPPCWRYALREQSEIKMRKSVNTLNRPMCTCSESILRPRIILKWEFADFLILTYSLIHITHEYLLHGGALLSLVQRRHCTSCISDGYANEWISWKRYLRFSSVA